MQQVANRHYCQFAVISLVTRFIRNCWDREYRGARCLLLAMAVLFALGAPSHAQAGATTDSSGTDFWVAFPTNYDASVAPIFYITGAVNTTGTVTIPSLSSTTPFTVTAGTVTTVTVPLAAEITASESNVVGSLGIHIVAANNVTVYGMNHIQASTDAYLALPTAVLGEEYRVMSYPSLGGGNASSELTIVGTVNSTAVTITPTVAAGGYAAGTPFTITLNEGQTFQLQAPTSGYDLTGTLINSDNPVAVYGGSACADVPVGTGYCNHLIEQMPPTSAWGKAFYTEPLATRLKGDTFRFLASVDNTTISVNGTVVTTLNSGKVYETILAAASVITANQPILVAQFSNGSTFDNVSADPFMMLVPPYEQYLTSYTITTPATDFTPNYVNVIAPTAGLSSLTMDSAAISPSLFKQIGSSGYSGAQVPLTVGAHTLAGSVPFGVIVYGFANVDGYGYIGGFSLSPVASVTSVSLSSSASTVMVGSQACLVASVTDQNGKGLSGIRVDFTVAGANVTTGSATTNTSGQGTFCYTGANSGQDTVTAISSGLSGTTAITWTAIPAAVTSTAVAIDPSSLMVGQTATIAATVTNTATSGTVGASGTATFAWTCSGTCSSGTSGNLNGGAAVNLDSTGTASISNAFSSTGTYLVTATYAGVSGAYTASSGSSSVIVSADTGATASAPAATSFGSIAVKSSTSKTLTFTFNSVGVIGTPVVVTQGATGLDFTDKGDGTCNTNGSGYVYNASDTCTVDVSFTPNDPGERLGAVKLLDNNGNILATTFISGTGLAPLAGFSPGTVSVPAITGLSPAMNGPRRPVFDAQGNLYVADMNNNRIDKIAANGAATVVLSSSTHIAGATLNQPNAVALDGAGNLYIADGGNYRVVELSAAGVASVLSNNGLTVEPIGIAVDVSGNVYVADNENNRIVEYPYGGSAKAVSISGQNLSGPAGIAVDGASNIFVADSGNNRIVKVSSGVGSVVSLGSLTLSDPRAITLDSPGNIYVSDMYNNRIVEIPAPSTGGAAMVLGMGASVSLSSPIGAAVSGAGDLYIMDANNNRIVISSQETAPSLAFDTTMQGHESADSPQAVTLLNLGNAPLAISVPGTGTNPSIAVGYTLGASTTCPTVSASGPAGSLAVGASCAYAVNFSPVTVGVDSGSLVLTDNNLGIAGSSQSISTSGTGIAPTITLSPSSTTLAAGAVGTPLSQTFTAGGGTGPYTYSYTGTLPVGVTLTNSGVLSGTPTTAGGPYSFTVTATDSQAFTGSQAYSLTVNKGAATVTLGSLSQAYTGSALAATATTTPSGLTVTYTYNGSTTVPTAAGSYTVVGTINDANYSGTATGTLVIGKATAAISMTPYSVTYDGKPHTATGTATGVGSADLSASLTLTGTAHTIAGTYASDAWSFHDATGNYADASGTVNDAIGKAALSVIANSKSMNYGDAVPALDGTLTGAISGDRITATYATTGTSTSVVGSYPITAALQDPSSKLVNYAVTNTPGSLTIGKATAAVALGSLTQTYTGSALPATAATTPTGLTVNLTYNGSVTAPAAAGSYAVVGTISDTNYAGTATGTLTINKAAQSIAFAKLPTAVTWGVAPLTLSATGGASGNDVTFSVVSGPGSITGNALSINGVGTVVVAANQAGNANYAAAGQATQNIAVAAANLNFSVSGGLAFGSVPVGTTGPAQTLIITNPNGSAVAITGIEASGDFSAVSNCPAIAAQGACSINVTFAPTATGARTGTLTITGLQTNGAQSISLTGTGTAPGIQVTPALLNFGSQVVTTTSTGQIITIQNTGTANLSISNIATTGDFTTSSNCASVPAGSNCSLAVTFTPTATGARTGTVTFTDNAGNGEQSQLVNLSGVGTVAGATLAPSTLTFPGTLVGATSFVLNTTLTNTGTAPLTGIGVSVLGDFAQTNTCPATLNPAATCTISIQYAPTIAGAESGSLIVGDNLGTQSVSLNGTGLKPGASLSTAQLVFGGQLVNTSTQAQTVVFTNSGSAPVSIVSVVPTADFAYTTNCSGAIAAGASCSINVIFTPTTTGPLSGTVTLTDSAGTQVITAQGQGISRGLALTPSFEIFGAQVVGTTSQAQTLTATNTGTVPLTLNPIKVSSHFVESDQCPAVLQAGASCAMSVSFSPTVTGPIAGSLVIGDTSGLVSALATVSGQGTLPGIAASPSTLFFGSLPVGTSSQAQTVTVSNTGTAPLQIGAVSGSGDFAETDTCAGQTLAAGSYCVISVTMTPTTTGTRTGAIQIYDNADGMHQIALGGMGQQAGVSVFPTSLAFGSRPFVSSALATITAGTPLSVKIANTGNVPLQLGGFSTQGDFTESNSCGTTVAVGDTCTLTVSFVPTALGHRTGTLTITDNAGGGTQMVTLAGDGNAAGLTLSPSVLNFGVQTKGVASKPQPATLTNQMGEAITNLAIAASGEFGESDNCGSTLANGASCTLNITVTPQTTGAITGTVTVSAATSNAPEVAGIRKMAFNSAASSSSSLSVGVVAVSATTNSDTSATTSQLSFATPPAPTVTAGGNAGSSVTVQEGDNNGNPVSGTDTITLAVSGPSGYSQTYTVPAVAGVATFNLSGSALTAAGNYTYTVTATSNAAINPAVTSETVSVSPAASVSVAAGSGQSAVINTAFPAALQITVHDAYGNPVSGTTVQFTAPATGASASLSSGSVTTNAAGAASVTAAANGKAGGYVVTAAVSGATSASFLMNNAKGTPTITWAMPAAIPYGTVLSAAQLNASVAGVAGSLVYTPLAGTVLGAGKQTLSVTFTPTDTADYNSVTQTVPLTVTQIASSVSVTTSSNRTLLQSAVTFTATVTSTAGTPTGTVNFVDGTTQLGSGTVLGGIAAYTTSSLAVGSHTITAVYAGDSNFIGSTSGTLSQSVIDYTLSAAAGSNTSQTVVPGASATYAFTIAPTAGTTLPAATTLTVTGLPAGATATLATAQWTQLTGTSWQLPANTALTNPSLTFNVPGMTASLESKDRPGSKVPPVLWGLLLLPFVGRMRRTGKKLSRMLAVLLLLAAGAAAMTGLSGCSSTSGFFGQEQKSYTVTVTATSGTLSHSTQVTLTVE